MGLIPTLLFDIKYANLLYISKSVTILKHSTILGYNSINDTISGIFLASTIKSEFITSLVRLPKIFL